MCQLLMEFELGWRSQSEHSMRYCVVGGGRYSLGFSFTQRARALTQCEFVISYDIAMIISEVIINNMKTCSREFLSMKGHRSDLSVFVCV